MESTHEEDQTDKQGLHQKTGVTMSYIQYVLGEAASEEFWGRGKHDLVYELWARDLQLRFEPFVIFQDVQDSLKGVSKVV